MSTEIIDDEALAIARGEETGHSLAEAQSESPSLIEQPITALASTVTTPPPPPRTASELRVEQVDLMLKEAYTRVPSITPEQQAVLQERFADDQIEVLPDSGLIYIPHILISQRLTKAFGAGGWSIIKRQGQREGDQIFCEYVLLVGGAYIGEAPAGATYYANNKKQSLDDVFEGTQGVALRRICGKSSLMCGSQVWEPDYARKWCYAHREEYWTEDWRTKKKVKRYKRREGSFKAAEPKPPKAAKKPAEAKPEPETAPSGSDGELEWWRTIPTPQKFGKWEEGTALMDIREENGSVFPALKNLWKGFKLVKDEKREAYVRFREALNAAGEYYSFNKEEKGK